MSVRKSLFVLTWALVQLLADALFCGRSGAHPNVPHPVYIDTPGGWKLPSTQQTFRESSYEYGYGHGGPSTFNTDPEKVIIMTQARCGQSEGKLVRQYDEPLPTYGQLKCQGQGGRRGITDGQPYPTATETGRKIQYNFLVLPVLAGAPKIGLKSVEMKSCPKILAKPLWLPPGGINDQELAFNRNPKEQEYPNPLWAHNQRVSQGMGDGDVQGQQANGGRIRPRYPAYMKYGNRMMPMNIAKMLHPEHFSKNGFMDNYRLDKINQY